MPFAVDQVDQHKTGLSDKQKGKWVSVANGVLKDCRKQGMTETKSFSRAVQIANSKFKTSVPFNGLFPQTFNITIGGNATPIPLKPREVLDPDDNVDLEPVSTVEDEPAGVETEELWLTPDLKEKIEVYVKRCTDMGGDDIECRQAAISKMKRGLNFNTKKFQYIKQTPADPFDGHMHTCAYDENGDGGTDMAGTPAHSHVIYGFRVQPYSTWDSEENKSYISVHPGSLAFGELKEIPEMEIFRVGTHNGDHFTEKDLENIVQNFHSLKNELRPKLKITHSDEQKSLAGLASYGDVVDVFLKKVEDGSRRLFAKVVRIPVEVYDWVKDGRFAERSIEIYPEFKLGTKEESPTYHNVLKAIALLGSQMPAVTGMEPIKLEECLECQGTMCFREKISAKEAAADYTLRIQALETSLRIERERLAV